MTVSAGRQAVISATWMTGGGYFSFALNFGANIILARMLFPQEFGLFALVSIVVELLMLPAGFSFSQGIIQMAAEPDIEDTAYVLTLRLGGVLSLIGIAAAAVIWARSGPAAAALLLVIFAVRLTAPFTYLYSAQLEREFRHRDISTLRIGSAVASVATVLLLALAGAGVWSLVGRETVSILMTYTGLRAITGWRYGGGYHAGTAKRLLAFGIRVFATRGLEIVNFRADAVLLGVLAGTVALGFYDRARFLGELGYYAVSFAAVQVAFPLYARFKTDPARLAGAYRIIHYFLIRLMLPLALVMVVMPDALVTLILGPRWQPSVPVLRWLAAFAFLLPLVDNAKVLLTGVGALDEALRIRVVQVLFTLPGLLVLIPRWGPTGAAAGLALGSLAAATVAYAMLRRRLADLALGMYVMPLIAGLLGIAAGAASLRTWLSAWPTFSASAAALATTGVLYLGILTGLEYPELRRNLRVIWPVAGSQVEEAL